MTTLTPNETKQKCTLNARLLYKETSSLLIPSCCIVSIL